MNTIRNFACLISLAAMGQLAACKLETACTLLACQDQVSTSFALTSAPSALDGATIKACRNNECVETKIKYTKREPIDGGGCPDTSGSGVQCASAGASPELTCESKSGVYLSCFGDASATGASLSVSLVLSGSSTKPTDGEALSFTVTSSTGTVLDTKTGTSKYEEQFPNGPQCGGGCKTAKL